MHRFGAVAEERGQVMHIPGVSGFSDEADADTLLGLDETLVHRSDREQHRDRRARLVGIAVADYEDRGASTTTHRGHRIPSELFQRALQLRGPGRGLPHRAERRDLRAAGAPQRGHLLRQQHRALDAQQRTAPGSLREQGAAAAEVHHQRHHQLFAERIDGRVGDLGEALAHVRVKALRHPRQRRDGRVVAHAPDRIAALGSHGRDDVAQVLMAVAKGALASGELLGGKGRSERRDFRGELA